MSIFKEIINMAINKEKEAIDDYTGLLTNDHYDNHKEIILKLIDFEKSHLAYLEGLRDNKNFVSPDTNENSIKAIKEVFMQDSKADKSNLIQYAIGEERKAAMVYRDMAKIFPVKSEEFKLFDKLAKEEISHETMLKDIK